MKVNRKIQIVALLLLLLSCFSGIFTEVVKASEREEEIILYKQDHLVVSYLYHIEEAEKQNIWYLKLSRISEKENYHQRFKLKVMDEDQKVIKYGTIEGMEQQEDWLVEKEFSTSNKKELSFELPKELKDIRLIVQMDEKKSKEEEEQDFQENILPNDLGCQLSIEKEKSKKMKTKASKINERNQEKQKENNKLAGPSLKSSNTPALRAGEGGLAYSLHKYTNKEPEYSGSTNPDGIYPTPSWKPLGQENVLNHQGGVETVAGWDGNTSWDTSNQNLRNSYIHYGYNADVADRASLSIRKMAMATEKEDEFNVRLNVRGQTNYEPGIDIVLVLDNSASLRLGPKEIALNMVKKLIDQLAQLKNEGKANIRIGSHTFSSYETSNQVAHSTFQISENPEDWKKIYGSEGYGKWPWGQTHTQRGLAEGYDLFEKAKETDEGAGKTYNRKKMMLVFTDGAPNQSWTPITTMYDSDMFYDKVRILRNDDKNSTANYKVGSSLGSTGTSVKFSRGINYGGYTINSHLTTTNSTAKDIKEQGVEIHTIAVDITKVSAEGHSESELIEGLFRMASRKANASGSVSNRNNYFFQYGSISDLEQYINEWYSEISYSIYKGKLDDPLGDMVDLVPNSVKISRAAGDPFTLPQVVMKENNRRLTVDNINLYKGQEIQIDYKVKLRTNDSAFEEGKWYQTNGKTTLEPTPEQSPDVLDFAVPSVRLPREEEVDIPVEKKWEDTRNNEEDFWGLRPDKIVASLQKKIGAEEVLQTDVTKNTNWKATLTTVLEEGEEFQVVEKDRVKGYAKAVSAPANFTKASLGSNTVTITNKLLTTDYTFKKVSHDGKTPFTGTDKPKFKVTRQAKNGLSERIVYTDIEPKTDGSVTIEKLPIGSYTVEETTVPIGHNKLSNFTIEVAENSAGTAVFATVAGQGSQLVVSNKLRDFTLEVFKVDSEDDPLNGASFKLTGPNGYDRTLFSGSTFNFTGLKPGNYALIEITVPDGYTGLKGESKFRIENDGSITYETNNPLVRERSSLANNKIELIIENKLIISTGALPSTGSIGGAHTKTAFVFIGIGVLLSFGSLYFNWKKTNI